MIINGNQFKYIDSLIEKVILQNSWVLLEIEF